MTTRLLAGALLGALTLTAPLAGFAQDSTTGAVGKADAAMPNPNAPDVVTNQRVGQGNTQTGSSVLGAQTAAGQTSPANAANDPIDPVTGQRRGQGTSQTGSSALAQEPATATNSGSVEVSGSDPAHPVTDQKRGQGTSQTGSSALAQDPPAQRSPLIGKLPPAN